MGTEDPKGDISYALNKYAQQNPGKSPTKLELNYRDVMNWHKAAGSHESFKDFIERVLNPYVQSCRLNQKTLDCTVTLLNVDSDQPTHFE
jgi:hypothetical protein